MDNNYEDFDFLNPNEEEEIIRWLLNKGYIVYFGVDLETGKQLYIVTQAGKNFYYNQSYKLMGKLN